MTKIVIKDRRFTNNKDCRKAWKTVIEFNPSEHPKLEVIPEVIRNHWKKNSSDILGIKYATFRGLHKYYAIKVHQLARTGRIRLGINRAGDICSYAIIKED